MDVVRPVGANPGGQVRLVFGADGYRVEPDRHPIAATLTVFVVLAQLAAGLGLVVFAVAAIMVAANDNRRTAILLGLGAAGCLAILGVFALVGRIASLVHLVSDGGAYLSFGRALAAQRSRPGARRGITWHAPGQARREWIALSQVASAQLFHGPGAVTVVVQRADGATRRYTATRAVGDALEQHFRQLLGTLLVTGS